LAGKPPASRSEGSDSEGYYQKAVFVDLSEGFSAIANREYFDPDVDVAKQNPIVARA